MHVHVLSDDPAKLKHLSASLAQACEVTPQLLANVRRSDGSYDAIVVAIDMRLAENIATLKELSLMIARSPKRVFVLDRPSRLSIMQAYALGATAVLKAHVDQGRLLTELLGKSAAQPKRSDLQILPGQQTQVATVAADYIATMFNSVLQGVAIDVENATNVGNAIVHRVAEDGLSTWLTTVRKHHVGTYQHCLLVTGVTIDFGLRLGFGTRDMERLALAAVLHDIGKAHIPLTVLDKPGKLTDKERKLIETHPVAGFEVLKKSSGLAPEILAAVRHHHEYLDGSGYPDGLYGASISDLTRILTVSDIFAALIEYRSYKPTMRSEDAYQILGSMHGKLETTLVKAFKPVALAR